MTSSRFVAGALVLLLVVHAAPARADGSAAATSLFDEGNRLYEAGDFGAACPKYEASLRLDASSLDTRGRLALCYEKTGRLASAWSAWREVKSRAGRTPGRERAVDIATQHIAALEPRLARVTLHAGAGAPAGLGVTLDGASFPLESLDVAVAIDAGKHRLEVTAPGIEDWSTELALSDGDRKTVELGPFTPRRTPVLGDATHSPAGARPPAPERPRAHRTSTRAWIGIATLGVGVIALGVAGVEGAAAMSQRDDADAAGCDHDLTHCTSADALARAHDAYDSANLATGFAIAGAAVAATGVILWLTAPPGAPVPETTAWRVVPSLGPGGAGVALSGAF